MVCISPQRSDDDQKTAVGGLDTHMKKKPSDDGLDTDFESESDSSADESKVSGML